MNSDDYAYAMNMLRSGSEAHWEELTHLDPSFPLGSDGFMGRRWILNAIDVGSLACVRWMISRKVELKFWDAEGRNVLEACIERDDPACKYDLLQTCIDAGADLNAFGFNGWAPLHLAAVRGDLLTVRMLLAAGADCSLRMVIDSMATPEEEALRVNNFEAASLIRNFAANPIG
jgi:ankyrin repeat protein